nr:hypothetical protein [Tanacetum cinerariifolium]
MRYEHPNTTLETESDEIIKSGVEELVPILSENEVTSEDKRECDMPVCENSPICDDHSEIFFDSNNDDDISSDDDDFEDIEYVEASLPDPEIVSLAEENGVEEENDVNVEEEEERLINVVKNDISDESDIRFLEALLSDDFIPFPNNESFKSDFDNLSIPQPLSEPPYADLEPNEGEEISVVMNTNDELECLDPRDEFDVSNDDNDD